ncbi:transposase [Streptomyces hirsutus]|uniref:transposase n=1 Tax=Streptomyces hirsutus TaxID=35620 RepID=UPI003689C482
MAEKRRGFTAEFREGAVRIVTETGKSIPEAAQHFGSNETTLASGVSRARRAGNGRGESEAEELARLRAENTQPRKDDKELGMERDALKRRMALWVK